MGSASTLGVITCLYETSPCLCRFGAHFSLTLPEERMTGRDRQFWTPALPLLRAQAGLHVHGAALSPVTDGTARSAAPESASVAPGSNSEVAPLGI